ncbi:hypothetical protein ATM97_29335 [Nocardia sp. MH4]|nr:hypothetical protein [Nocardia sp. MH4]
MIAKARSAVNDSQNAPPAMTTVSAVAARRAVGEAVCARVSRATPCTAASKARGGMTATVAATAGKTVVWRTAWVALPTTLTPAAMQSSVQKKTCARSMRTSSLVVG